MEFDENSSKSFFLAIAKLLGILLKGNSNPMLVRAYNNKKDTGFTSNKGDNLENEPENNMMSLYLRASDIFSDDVPKLCICIHQLRFEQ